MSAVISDCGRYRYTLERPLAPKPLNWLLWVMFNPSTADATIDDPTIRRVMGFTRRWGYQGALVGNLYAYRATKPADLLREPDRVGPINDEHLNQLALRASRIVIAWGANADRERKRADDVERMLRRRVPLYALGLTAGGQPVHPLYQPQDAELIEVEA